MNGKDHLNRVAQLIASGGERDRKHGNKFDTFTEIGRRWSQHLGCPVSPEQVAVCMIEMKLVRSVQRILPERVEDMAGYAGCALEVLDVKNDA